MRNVLSSSARWMIFYIFLLYLSKLTTSEKLYHERRKELYHEGYKDVTLSRLYLLNDRGSAIQSIRNRRSAVENTTTLEFRSFGRTFRFSLKRPDSILHPDAIITITNGHKSSEWKGQHPDCFLTGHMNNGDGIASLSLCERMVGGIRSRGYTYHLEETDKSRRSRRHPHEVLENVIIARKRNKREANLINSIESQRRRTRSTPNRNVTIEMAVYTDAAFTATFPSEDIRHRVALMVMKYNGVQMEYSRRDMLDYYVKILIKKINFFEKNPVWYNASTDKLGDILSSFCLGTMGELPYDHIYLHTGIRDLDVTGRAYQNSMCVTRYRCATDKQLSFTEFVATAHEIGHNIGMYHDADRGCNGTNVGNMGGYGAGWSTCSRNDMNAYLKLDKAKCVFEENVQLSLPYNSNATSWNQEVQLSSAMPGDVYTKPSFMSQQTLSSTYTGLLYTGDEICEMKYRPGYRYREFPLVGPCNIHSCVNHDITSADYGRMYKQESYIPGLYCGPSQICFQHGCKNATEAKQYDLIEREGNWNSWGEWSGCSRTCGRGVNFRHRSCTNPTPKNHPACPGDEFDGVICNPEPCIGDADNEADLKLQRASETCAKFIELGIIDSNLYQPTGERFSWSKHGQCEVKCDPVEGYTRPTFTRFGLMPHGTPCKGEDADPGDINNWPRRPGYTHACVDGSCERFGCDNKLNGATFDNCGVCGGDGTTCNSNSTIDTTIPGKGERVTIFILAEGSYDVLFYFRWQDMKQNFLEVWTMDDEVVLASYISKSWVWNTKDKPVDFAGTSWNFVFSSQYLYARGPITQPLQIKLFQNKDFNNTGISCGFSEPIPEIIPCTFDDQTQPFCNWNNKGWNSTNKYNDTAAPDNTGTFIYVVSDTASLTTLDISPSSRPQCLYFRYILYGSSSSGLTIALQSGQDVIWNGQGSTEDKWRCGAASITSLQKDKIVISATVSGDLSSTLIALDDVNVLSEKACTAVACENYLTTTPVPSTTPLPPSTTPLPEPWNIMWVVIAVAVIVTCVVVLIIAMLAMYLSRKNSDQLVVNKSRDETDSFGTHREQSSFKRVDSYEKIHLEQPYNESNGGVESKDVKLEFDV